MSEREPSGDPDERAAGSDRLVLFTDAVVAIAVTLLALPLVDLVAEPGAGERGLGALLLGHLGALIAFLLSFAIISRFWWAHHELMRLAARASWGLAAWNSLWVLAVVVLPFATQVTVSLPAGPGPAALYGADLVLCSAALLGLGAALVRHPGLREAGTGGSVRAAVLGSATSCALLVVAAAVASLVPLLEGWAYLLLFASGPAEGLLRRTPVGRWARAGQRDGGQVRGPAGAPGGTVAG